MRTGRRWVWVIAILGLVVAGLLVADHLVRRDIERRVSEAVVAELGGEVTTRLGGWPFLMGLAANRLESAHITVTNATVDVGERQGTIERAELTIAGLSPVRDLDQARAEQLDARVQMTWGQLTTLVGFPVSHVQGDRISARTSVEVFGVVAVIELQSEVSVDPGGQLVLRDPTASAVGVDLPRQVVQFAVDLVAPQLKLPVFAGLTYEGLDMGPDGIAARLHGTDVAIAGLG